MARNEIMDQSSLIARYQQEIQLLKGQLDMVMRERESGCAVLCCLCCLCCCAVLCCACCDLPCCAVFSSSAWHRVLPCCVACQL